MKSEAEVDETATKKKNTGSKISAYMEQKLDKKSQEPLHIMLLQALIWGNTPFYFVHNPFFIRFLSKLRSSYCLPTSGATVAEASATLLNLIKWHATFEEVCPSP